MMWEGDKKDHKDCLSWCRSGREDGGGGVLGRPSLRCRSLLPAHCRCTRIKELPPTPVCTSGQDGWVLNAHTSICDPLFRSGPGKLMHVSFSYHSSGLLYNRKKKPDNIERVIYSFESFNSYQFSCHDNRDPIPGAISPFGSLLLSYCSSSVHTISTHKSRVWFILCHSADPHPSPVPRGGGLRPVLLFTSHSQARPQVLVTSQHTGQLPPPGNPI